MHSRKGLSFFAKLLLGDLLLVALIVAVGGFVAYRRLDATHQVEVEAHQKHFLRTSRQYLEGVWPELDARRGQVEAMCRRLTAGSSMRLTVIAADGTVLGDSAYDPNAMENHDTPGRPEVRAALAGQAGRDVRPSETLGMEFRYIAEPVRRDGRVVGVARAAMPVRAIAARGRFIREALLAAAGTAAVAAVVLAVLLSWLWYAPLRQITRAARSLAAGDLSQRAAVEGSREMAQLGAALNEMRQNTAARMQQLAAQRENLHTVIDSLEEAVIALDRQGRVALLNRSAAALLAGGNGGAVGKPLPSVVRVAGVVDAANDAARRQAPHGRQVTADIAGRRRTLDVHVVPLAGDAAEDLAVLVVVRDITDLLRIAQVKAEFVANASHELRTPLATIRAAVDSLADLAPADSQELLRLRDILNRHTARLEDLTRDLLNLHALETGGPAPRREAITLGALAAWVREEFAEPARRRGIDLAAESNQPNAEFASDVRLLHLVLQNLLDNALKFTPSGGRVTCRFDADDGRVVLSVADTGCGIPQELQDRVFERFFQADAARSGEPKARGTGLGLAIVKHACERLGADVKLESRLGRGTTVTVSLPPT